MCIRDRSSCRNRVRQNAGESTLDPPVSWRVRLRPGWVNDCRKSRSRLPIDRGHSLAKGKIMLRLALVFLILALIAGAVGAYNVAVLASDIGWLLLVVFL